MVEDDDTSLRAQVEAEFGLFSNGEVARRSGSKGHSPTAAVRRWVAARKIFAVPSPAGIDVFPGFCFDGDGRPRPGVAVVIKAFGPGRSGWDLAGWFVTPSPHLGGRRPVDVLDGDADELRRAVQSEPAT